MQYSKSQALERTKLGLEVDRKDFFYYLLNARNPETGLSFSVPELWGESNMHLIAGNDTTSTALAATFFYLVRSSSQRGLVKLRKKILDMFGGIDHVEDIHSGPKLNSCVYLRACVDEAMRMSPPVGGLLPREVLTGGLSIDGYKIPAGSVIGVPTYAIHHNEKYFPKDEKFIPERWIPNITSDPLIFENSAHKIEVAKSAYCPFSIGPRGCIGKTLAYTELRIAVARTVCLFEMIRVGKLKKVKDEWEVDFQGGREVEERWKGHVISFLFNNYRILEIR